MTWAAAMRKNRIIAWPPRPTHISDNKLLRVKKIKRKQSLLWKIQQPENPQVSYLFGTMHVRDLRAFEWLELAKKHLAECEVFATEFDFSEADPSVLSAALELPGDADLEKLLSPRSWKNLDRYAQANLGASAENFRFQHPMMVSTALSMAILAAESAYSLDETLWRYAKSLGKETAGVETFSGQIETLHRIPFKQHVKSLTWLLKNRSRHKKRLQKMLQCYARADIQTLYQSAKKDAKGMRKALLFRRNKLMAKRFAEISAVRSLFCAVGAGHLAGGKGMLRILKQAGFLIKPVFD